MTDQAQIGPADGAGIANAAGSANGASGADAAMDAGAGGGGLLDGLGEDNRRVAEAKGWDTADKVVESYRNLEAKIGDSLRPPADDAAPEDWQAFYARLGRPDDPSAYEFKMPAGLSENFPYDEGSVTAFAQWAHEAGLSGRQAQGLHDRFVHYLNAQFVSSVDAHEDGVAEAHGEIIDQWGEPSTEKYRRNVELADRALRELGGDGLAQSLRTRGAITADGEIADPAIAFMLQKAGERLYSEDQVFGANARTANPFAREGENVTEQGRLLRSDPELARNFIRAANREAEFPRLFGNEF